MILIDCLAPSCRIGPLIAYPIIRLLIELVVVTSLLVGHDRTLVHPIVPRTTQTSTKLSTDLQILANSLQRHDLSIDSGLTTEETTAVVFSMLNCHNSTFGTSTLRVNRTGKISSKRINRYPRLDRITLTKGIIITLTATLTGVLDDRQVRILSDIKPFIYIEVGIRTQRVTTEPRLLNRSLTVRVTQTNRISCLLATTSYRYLMILNHTGLFNQIQPIGTFSCLFLRIAILQHLIVSGTRPSIGSVILIRSFPSINATKLLNDLLFRQTCRLDRIRHSQMTCSIRAN